MHSQGKLNDCWPCTELCDCLVVFPLNVPINMFSFSFIWLDECRTCGGCVTMSQCLSNSGCTCVAVKTLTCALHVHVAHVVS